jgi:hypothetical protein
MLSVGGLPRDSVIMSRSRSSVIVEDGCTSLSPQGLLWMSAGLLDECSETVETRASVELVREL